MNKTLPSLNDISYKLYENINMNDTINNIKQVQLKNLITDYFKNMEAKEILNSEKNIFYTEKFKNKRMIQDELYEQYVSDRYIIYEKWLNELDYINTTMRTIRKVQCECSLLDLCHNQPEIMDKEYQGYLFDKINRNDGLFQYIIYLPELKLTSKITLREHYDHFQMEYFKLYLFNNEDKFKKKIRLHLVSRGNNHV